MSWDISIQDIPRDITSVTDIPDDFQPRPIGPRDALIARICEALPATDFSDPTWGVLVQSEFTIEFNMGKQNICDDFMLHVRGGGSAMATIVRLLEHLQLRGFDCQTGDFFSIDEAEKSFGQWQKFRDQAIGRPDDRPA
jgi:hypothetical protein